jgi:hypothetical protein
MFSARTKQALYVASVLVLLAIVLVARHFSGQSDATARAQFLRFVPSGTTSVIFVDLDSLRSSPFLAALYSWAPHPAEDSEYREFVEETGFDYERDLGKIFIAISNHEAASRTLLLAEGKFDRKKIEAFLARHGSETDDGGLKVFVLRATRNDKPLSVAFLRNQRIAITDSESLATTLTAAVDQADHAGWQTRFDRVAGTPAFAIVRQDPAFEMAVNGAAPGGYRSPQLAALLDQLEWISLAAKPDGGLLRLVAEGECPSGPAATELHDFLEGIQVLAQNGLNDPKLRQKMNADERQAYLELLKSAAIEKIDRGDGRSVRLVLSITPQFLSLAKLSGLATGDSSAAPAPPTDRASRAKKSPSTKKK